MEDGTNFYSLRTIDKLLVIGFISTLAFAFDSTIWSVYIDSFLHNASYVGFLFSFFMLLTMASYFFFIPIIERHNKILLYSFSTFLFAVSYFAFGYFNSFYVALGFGIVVSLAAAIRDASFGILIVDKTEHYSISKNEGLVYTAASLSWLIGPVIAGFVLSKYGLSPVFYISALMLLVSLVLISSFKLRDTTIHRRIDKDVLKVAVSFFKDRNRLLAYFIKGGTSVWWSFIYVYIPIYIIESGLGGLVVGYFLAAVILPLILCEYFFGALAGRKGFKMIFLIGYFLTGVFSIAGFFVFDIYTELLLLAIASFGMSMIEGTSEAYFFDLIRDHQRDRYYPIYRTTYEFNYFLATAVTSSLLLLLPFKFIFILYGVFMFIFALISLMISDRFEFRRS